jgi:hypothetical protein
MSLFAIRDGTLQLGGMFVACKPATATAPAASIAKEETS